jgi:acetyl esterase/lipase
MASDPTGWAFLVVSLNGAAYTLNAYRPARNNRLLFGWSFFASWITIELAPFHLIWQIVATTVFVSKGALRSRPGRLGLVVTVASWVGLALSIRQSFAARHEIREALRELRHERPEGDRLPVKVTHDVPFARAGGRSLRFDVHAPDVAPEPGVRRPVLVQVHGGGWVIGFKDRQGQLLMKEMASQGWVCFNVDYRLSPTATFPDHLVDVKRAIAWIREHADDYGIDPGFIAVTGGSAGGHLSALTALTAGRTDLQPGFEQADTSVNAAVPFYGVYDFTNRNGFWPAETVSQFLGPVVMKSDPDQDPSGWALASPLDQVREDAPPFFVVHGDKDLLAPVEDARDFVERLRRVSSEPVYYLELRGAQHAFEMFASIRANAVVEAVGRFLDAVHTAYVRGLEDSDAVETAVGEELGEELAAELSGEN